jgi:NADH-quinone oxidoreductase, chain G
MTDDVITIEVDGRTLEARKGQMLIEVTDGNDIYVPRFCYHRKLTIAANCRMCLVDVEKAPKPLPACATPVMDGMKVHTRSQRALEAQKAVMEFLLINHPLDCPICDQGGECELQDLAMGYGRDVSRYQEKKRVVQDKNIGPLVQTDMTRCIHCTRCVRFGQEIAGLRELGATGRGEDMEIGTYIEKSMVSEMSGNVIDLCPVGALTSKPFRYSARAWEIQQRAGIAPHDAVGSNIHLHIMQGRVKRVVPAENEAVNEVWLSDRDRFSYEGLYHPDRLTVPMIRERGAWQEVDWETALQFAMNGLQQVKSRTGTGSIGALTSPASTLEELFLLQKWMRGIGCHNIDHRIRQRDFSDQDIAPAFPWLGTSIADLERLDAVLLIGGNVRKEQPIINHRLRKAAMLGARC